MKSLSGGQRQSVAIARAVHFNARILIMDEPTAALGPAETAQVRDLVRQLKAEGIGIFLISHDIHDVYDLSDRISVMYHGRVVDTVTKDKSHHRRHPGHDHHGQEAPRGHQRGDGPDHGLSLARVGHDPASRAGVRGTRGPACVRRAQLPHFRPDRLVLCVGGTETTRIRVGRNKSADPGCDSSVVLV